MPGAPLACLQRKRLPEGMERLIRLFAWEPTPSASAVRNAARTESDAVTISDNDARVMCPISEKPMRCWREWQILPDGDVHMLFDPPEGYCDCSEVECGRIGGRGLCQGLSMKSTWEVCWENATRDLYDETRRDEVREYVRKQLYN